MKKSHRYLFSATFGVGGLLSLIGGVNELTTAMASSDTNDAQQIVNRYPAGTKVEVYYNPEDPAQGILEPGATVGSYILLLLGLVFLCVGIGFAVKTHGQLEDATSA